MKALSRLLTGLLCLAMVLPAQAIEPGFAWALAPKTLFSTRDKRISEEDFCDRISGLITQHTGSEPYCIGIGGGAGAGKTTYSKRLKENLEKRGHKVLVIGMDSFFAGPQRRAELTAQGHEWNADFVRVDEISRILSQIKNGIKTIPTERFVRDPAKNIRRLEPWTISLDGFDTVIFEGLWALSPKQELGGLLNFMDTTLYVDAATPHLLRWRRQREKEKGSLARSPEAFQRHWNLGILPDLRNNIRPSRAHADYILRMGGERSMTFSLGPRIRRKTALRVAAAWPSPYVHAKIIEAFTKTGRFQIADNGGASPPSQAHAFGLGMLGADDANAQKDLLILCREAKDILAKDSDYRLLQDEDAPFTRYVQEARIVGVEGLAYNEDYGVAGDDAVLSLYMPSDILEKWLSSYRSKEPRSRKDAVLELASVLFEKITGAMLNKKFEMQKRKANDLARLSLEKNMFVRKRLVTEELAADFRAARGRLSKELGLRARMSRARTFAERLQIAVAARKLRSAENLAAAMQVRARKVQRWLGGTGNPTPPMLAKLAKVLNVPEDLLRYGKPRYQAELDSQNQKDLEREIRSMPRERDWKKQLPAVMKLAMRQTGVTVERIASFTGVGRENVKNWLNGKAYPGARYKPLLARVLKIPRNSVELLMFARDLEEELYDDTLPGRRIQKARLARGLTLRQLAALAGIKHATQLIHWEKGKENIPETRWKPLAAALTLPRWLLQSHKTAAQRMCSLQDEQQKARAFLQSAA